MRVLAIIPACEGSTTLPNKNMRVLNGKPMIYYVINNAKKCKYVNDVIVTSNSDDIVSLAKQMHVLTRKRESKLSSSSISIDEVVMDVFKQLNLNEYDVVITMQSISPMLKHETLELAFESFISNNYDTLISVKNMQYFFWKSEDNKVISMQEKRMNRHQLPPFFVETGAFLITKSTFVKKNSRIGNDIGLFELHGDEAIDVNDFGDLQLVENAMNRKNTAIFVNGYNEIGLGHIARVLQIADELFSKPDIYYDSNLTDRNSFGDTKYNLIPVDGFDGFIGKIKEKHYDIIINDILDTDIKFMQSLKNASPKTRIINFEDDGNGAVIADVVINALYENKKERNVVCGSRFFIVPKLFLIFNPIIIRKKVKNIVVTFGGADPKNYTETVLNIISGEQYQDKHFYVVLGRANKNANMIADKYKDRSNITVLCDINNIAEIMFECDVAISSRGRTCFELAALGIPTLSIAQHSREELHTFVCEDNGFICLSSNPSEKSIIESVKYLITSNQNYRINMQKRMLKHDLRNGRKNVAMIISKK